MAFGGIAVVGAGAGGTALADVAVRAGCAVTLRARDAKTAAVIANTRESPHLPGLPLDHRVAVTGDLAAAARADAILLAVPAQALREVAAILAPSLKSATPVIACADGIERCPG